MTLTLLTPPTGEPISLDEAKSFARIETGDEDALIGALITGARLRIEAMTGLALMTQTWRYAVDAPTVDRVLRLPIGPVQAIEAVAIVDRAGGSTVVAAADIEADLPSGRVRLKAGPSLAGLAMGGVQVTARVGYGSAAAVPEPLKQAIRLLVAAAYDDRGEAGAGSMPPGVEALLAPYRRRRL